jgi:short subunit dehydrogenase-like uncharacterized protein
MERGREREFDVIVWGATGFTGRLVAAAFVDGAPVGLRWAIGGRDRGRLEALRSELGVDVGVVVADAHDPDALAALARRTRVVAATVGPYARHGTPLVAACVSAGTDCADLTGETTWMRRSIDAFDAAARASGARIVHACGFDSVPSDLGVWRLQREALARHGRPSDRVEHEFGPLSGGVSGGTLASALALLEAAASDPGVRRQLADPDLLAPGSAPTRPPPSAWWPQRSATGSGWTAPFPMAAVNERVVRRSRALAGEPWGPGFRYRERWWLGSGPAGAAAAAAVGVGLSVGPALLAIGPLRRWFAAHVGPKPGEGPDAARRARGFFRTTLTGRVPGAAAPVVVHVGAALDPGYGATAVMLRDVALELAAAGTGPGGVLTPAVALGDRLIARLERSGVRFDVVPAAGPAAASERGPRAASAEAE